MQALPPPAPLSPPRGSSSRAKTPARVICPSIAPVVASRTPKAGWPCSAAITARIGVWASMTGLAAPGSTASRAVSTLSGFMWVTKSATYSDAGFEKICRALPHCTIRPPSIKAMRLPSLKASSRSWLTKMMVRFSFSCSASNSSCRRVRISGSSAENGSSISKIGASVAKARARPTRCCMPPDSSPTLRLAQSDRPTSSS